MKPSELADSRAPSEAFDHPDPSAYSFRNLPPVDEDVVLSSAGDNAVSQTILNYHERCDRAAFLAAKHRDGPSSVEMNRGIAYHEFARLAVLELVRLEQNMMSVERAKLLMLEVLEENYELTMPASERDALRYMAAHFAEGTYIEPKHVIGVEMAFELELEGFVIRLRIDRVEVDEFGTVTIRDYKTSWATADAQEFVPADRVDAESGSRYSGDFQTQLYALAYAIGKPADTGINLGEEAQRFRLILEYPRFQTDAGILTREAWIDRRQLEDFEFDVVVQLRRLRRSLDTRQWQAVPGSHCAICPAPRECPIPRQFRPDSQLPLDAPREEAERLADWHARHAGPGGDVAAVGRRLKKWADANGGHIRRGRDEIYDFQVSTREEIRDKGELRIAVEGATKFGHPFNMADHVKVMTPQKFGKRRLSADERRRLDEQQRNGDGGESAEGAGRSERGGEVARTD